MTTNKTFMPTQPPTNYCTIQNVSQALIPAPQISPSDITWALDTLLDSPLPYDTLKHVYLDEEKRDVATAFGQIFQIFVSVLDIARQAREFTRSGHTETHETGLELKDIILQQLTQEKRSFINTIRTYLLDSTKRSLFFKRKKQQRAHALQLVILSAIASVSGSNASDANATTLPGDKLRDTLIDIFIPHVAKTELFETILQHNADTAEIPQTLQPFAHFAQVSQQLSAKYHDSIHRNEEGELINVPLTLLTKTMALLQKLNGINPRDTFTLKHKDNIEVSTLQVIAKDQLTPSEARALLQTLKSRYAEITETPLRPSDFKITYRDAPVDAILKTLDSPDYLWFATQYLMNPDHPDSQSVLDFMQERDMPLSALGQIQSALLDFYTALPLFGLKDPDALDNAVRETYNAVIYNAAKTAQSHGYRQAVFYTFRELLEYIDSMDDKKDGIGQKQGAVLAFIIKFLWMGGVFSKRWQKRIKNQNQSQLQVIFTMLSEGRLYLDSIVKSQIPSRKKYAKYIKSDSKGEYIDLDFMKELFA